ncbi:hypothetical protein M514_00128 [Trichuris suis]|uniref:BTB domain-containing protein n=1 Tax=Trichuris suis TaxID=68888 RepID=A0A085NU46_9BILA|nr:hypothetical protein M513_00128 [Trichuris suis]KFD72992.1 hypothetical protein M514_00128 [Trichuris suis]
MHQTTLAYCFGVAGAKKFCDSGSSTRQSPGLPSTRSLNNDSNQLIIDAGQKDFAVRCCAVCRMPYNPDLADDVKEHARYHAEVTARLVRVPSHLAGKLHIVAQFLDGYIARLELSKLNKSAELLTREILSVACSEVGACAQTLMDNKRHRQMYVFISSGSTRRVIGVVVVEATAKALLVGADGCASDQTKSLAFGVLLIWVSSCSRRQGIGTRLVNTARANFLPGSKLVNADCVWEMERDPYYRPAVVNCSFEQQRNQAQERSQVVLRECTVSTVVVCDPENVESPEEWENQQYLPPPRSRRSSSLNRNRSSSERDLVNSPGCHRASVTLNGSESSVSASPEASNYVIRPSQATLRERNASMLYSDLMADVWFVVGNEASPGGQKRIPAHTYVLATGSTVFYAMFFGGFSKNTEIPVPDVEPEAFKIMLRYLYTDEVHLDPDTVIPTLYVAKKYLIEYLVRACIDFLQNSLTSKNVCFLLSQSRLFEEEELVARCWEMIDAQAELALFSDSFWEVDFETLTLILRRETLNARESKIFEAAIRWAEYECQRLQLEATPISKRHVLGSAFHLIRFPAMKVEEFAVEVVNSGVLTSEECVDIFMHHFSEKESQLAFPKTPRLGLPLKRCHRFQSSAYRNNQWRYRGRCDSIQFCTDRRIFIAGFGLFGSSNGSAKYQVRLELKRSGQVLASLDTCFFSDGSSKIFPVFFEQPVQIEADVYYTAGIVLEGNELSYFGQEGMPEVQVHNVTFQFQCSTESTNGTGVQGGQIPEILFY